MKKSLEVKKVATRWRPGLNETKHKGVSRVDERSASRTASRSEARSSTSGLTLLQIKTLKLRLSEIREELVRSVQMKTQTVLYHATELENTLQGDDAEVAEKQRLSNANLQELEFLKTRLQLVDRALLKLQEGCYGICEETEEPIGFERLQVVPWARFSIKIQERREIRSREFGRAQRTE